MFQAPSGMYMDDTTWVQYNRCFTLRFFSTYDTKDHTTTLHAVRLHEEGDRHYTLHIQTLTNNPPDGEQMARKARLYPLGDQTRAVVTTKQEIKGLVSRAVAEYQQFLSGLYAHGAIEVDESGMDQRFPVWLLYGYTPAHSTIHATEPNYVQTGDKKTQYALFWQPVNPLLGPQSSARLTRQAVSGRAAFVRREPFHVALVRPPDPTKDLILYVCSNGTNEPYERDVRFTLDHFPLLSELRQNYHDLLPPDTILLCDVVPLSSFSQYSSDNPQSRRERIQYVYDLGRMDDGRARAWQDEHGYLVLSVWDIVRFAGLWTVYSHSYQDRMGTIMDIEQSIECGSLTDNLRSSLSGAGIVTKSIDRVSLRGCPPCLFAAPSVPVDRWRTDVTRSVLEYAEEHEWDRAMAVDPSVITPFSAIPFYAHTGRSSAEADRLVNSNAVYVQTRETMQDRFDPSVKGSRNRA